jgi:putative acetyltransferase
LVAGEDEDGQMTGAMRLELGEARPEDTADIVALFAATFGDSEGPEEGEVIAGLARDMIGTTAPEDIAVHVGRFGGVIVGCIMFSRLRMGADSRRVFILSPVAVATAVQGRGVGQALLRHGLDTMRSRGVEVVVTYGDPGYYARVGFGPVGVETVPPPRPLSQPDGWLAQSLTGDGLEPLPGPSVCVAALDRAEYW